MDLSAPRAIAPYPLSASLVNDDDDIFRNIHKWQFVKYFRCLKILNEFIFNLIYRGKDNKEKNNKDKKETNNKDKKESSDSKESSKKPDAKQKVGYFN